MKKIKIFPIKSMMSHGNFISNDSSTLLAELKNRLNDFEFEIVDDIKSVNKNDFLLILVQSGGSEGIFKSDIYSCYEGPYYLLTYGSSNSLAASLEILTFLKNNCKNSEVLHGNYDYIAERIICLYEHKPSEKVYRLGVFGKPSDWLISSDVDYKKVKEIFNIELIDVDQDEIINDIKLASSLEEEISKYVYDKFEISKALKIYEGLKKTVARYNLDGFTIRCFDILSAIKSSACLALALFNKDDVVASCEGDIPAMLTAFLLKLSLDTHAFQANPQWIDPMNNEIYFAHCTLPLDMCSKYELDTHFESGIGVGIHGEMIEGPVTVVKIGSGLNEFYCEEGELLLNEYRKDRCRTQVKIKMNAPVKYFLSSSLGNHHQIIYGHHKNEIKEYLEQLGLRNVVA